MLWRPNYECELAVVSNVEFDTAVKATQPMTSMSPTPSGSPNPEHTDPHEAARTPESHSTKTGNISSLGDSVEIWDVRRQYVAKWAVRGSAYAGGVTGKPL